MRCFSWNFKKVLEVQVCRSSSGSFNPELSYYCNEFLFRCLIIPPNTICNHLICFFDLLLSRCKYYRQHNVIKQNQDQNFLSAYKKNKGHNLNNLDCWV